MAVISVSDCRRCLGAYGRELADNQVKRIRDTLIQIVNFSLQQAKKQWTEQNKSKK